MAKNHFFVKLTIIAYCCHCCCRCGLVTVLGWLQRIHASFNSSEVLPSLLYMFVRLFPSSSHRSQHFTWNFCTRGTEIIIREVERDTSRTLHGFFHYVLYTGSFGLSSVENDFRSNKWRKNKFYTVCNMPIFGVHIIRCV